MLISAIDGCPRIPCLHTCTCSRPSQHVNNRTKLKGAAARPYDKDAAAIQKWEADVKPTFVLINDLDVKNEKTPSLNSELERTIRSRCAHSEVVQKIG